MKLYITAIRINKEVKYAKCVLVNSFTSFPPSLAAPPSSLTIEEISAAPTHLFSSAKLECYSANTF